MLRGPIVFAAIDGARRMSSDGLVVELTQKALDQNVSVGTLLRIAKTIAVNMELEEALVWIDGELNGYMDEPIERVPKYRVLRGEVRGLSRSHGWGPVQFENPQHAEQFSTAHLGLSIAAMEQGLRDDSGRAIAFQWHPYTKQHLMAALPGVSDVALELSRASIRGAIDAVRNMVLDWALELEKQGVLGSGAALSPDEKLTAQKVTHTYIIQNAGVVGNISDRAQVTNKQSAQVDIDVALLQDVVGQARQHLSGLPSDRRAQFEPIIDEIDQEVSAGGQNKGRLRELAESAKRVCEGASGNLVASGIASMLSALL